MAKKSAFWNGPQAVFFHGDRNVLAEACGATFIAFPPFAKNAKGGAPILGWGTHRVGYSSSGFRGFFRSLLSLLDCKL